MAANPGFPVTLDVKGYVVLVLGGDEEAAEKTQRLLDAGAKVIVISPTLHERLKQLAASAKVIHRGRHFRETDLESAVLVLNMIRGDKDFARALFAKARERKFVLWSVDFPEASTANMPDTDGSLPSTRPSAPPQKRSPWRTKRGSCGCTSTGSRTRSTVCL